MASSSLACGFILHAVESAFDTVPSDAQCVAHVRHVASVQHSCMRAVLNMIFTTAQRILPGTAAAVVAASAGRLREVLLLDTGSHNLLC